MTSKSWTAYAIGIWKKRAGITLTRFVFSPLIFIVHVVWLAAVLCVLLPWLSLDYLPKRRSKPLTSPTPNRRKLPVPIREGSDIFVIMPDGTKVPLEPLQAKLQAEAWFQVVAGGFVYERTRLRGDTEA